MLSPMRNSSWNDVLGQGLGAIVGALAWTVTGPSCHGCGSWRTSASHLDLLAVFCSCICRFICTAVDVGRRGSRGEARDEVRRGPRHGDAVRVPLESTFLVMRDFAGNALLNIPIGMLAALGWVRESQRRAIGWAVLRGVAMIVLVEIAKEFVGWVTPAWATSLRGLSAATRDRAELPDD